MSTERGRRYLVRRHDGFIAAYYPTIESAQAQADTLTLRSMAEGTNLTFAAVQNPHWIQVEHSPGPDPDPASVEYWLLQLVTAADDDERLHVGVAACAAGHSQALVRCVRCWPADRLPLMFPAMVRHVRQIEVDYQVLYPGEPNAAAHGPADIHPAPTATKFRPLPRRGGVQ